MTDKMPVQIPLVLSHSRNITPYRCVINVKITTYYNTVPTGHLYRWFLYRQQIGGSWESRRDVFSQTTFAQTTFAQKTSGWTKLQKHGHLPGNRVFGLLCQTKVQSSWTDLLNLQPWLLVLFYRADCSTAATHNRKWEKQKTTLSSSDTS